MVFSTFMKEWLYGDDGYYDKYREIGKGGDFYTAVSSSPFFGYSIAKRFLKLIDEKFFSQNTTILEIGAHKGYLLADMIQLIYTFKSELLNSLTFAILEKKEHVRLNQEQYLRDSFGDSVKLKFYKSFDEISLDSAFIVANEIFDSFPCELIYQEKLAIINDFKIDFDYENVELISKAKEFGIVRGEFAMGYEEFAKELSNAIKKFEFITFDYGETYPRNEFSIRVYKSHQVFPLFDEALNLRDVFKNCDITYDVNFTHLIKAFELADIKKVDYKTQISALIEFGILDLLEILRIKAGEVAYQKELNRVKTLIHPSFMGERFKMVAFRKE